jgi:hypothetical protein
MSLPTRVTGSRRQVVPSVYSMTGSGVVPTGARRMIAVVELPPVWIWAAPVSLVAVSR